MSWIFLDLYIKVHKFQESGTLKITPVEHLFGSSNELLMQDSNQLYKDFHGRALKVSTLNNNPFMIVSPTEFDYVVHIGGIEMHMLKTLSKVLNFTYRLYVPADEQWGEVKSDGTVTGVVGMVARRETHFAAAELTILGPREKVVDFTQPYYTEPTTLHSLAPQQKSSALAVFAPFKPEIWLYIVAITVAVCPVMCVFVVVTGEDKTTTSWKSVAWKYCFRVVGVVLYQATSFPFRRTSMRILLFLWYIFGFIIFTLYSDVLIAFLISPEYEKPIDSLEDFLKATEEGNKMIVNPGSSMEYIFKKASSGIYHDIWEKFDPSVGYVTNTKIAVEKILNHKYSYVNARVNSEVWAIKKGRNKFHLAKETFYPQNYAMASYSGAPFQNVFSKILLRMTECGLFAKWEKDELDLLSLEYHEEAIKGKKSESGEEGGGGGGGHGGRSVGVKPLSLNHVQATFELVLGGSVIATITLFLEIIWSRSGHRLKI